MEQQDFTTVIEVNRSPIAVFEAINNVRDWWQGEVVGETEKVDDEFTYRMRDIHFSRQKVIESSPGRRVIWLVTDSEINFVANSKEWVNTKIIFDITAKENKTTLTFTHQGLLPKVECYDNCSGAWHGLIEKSLFSYILTGKGVDIF